MITIDKNGLPTGRTLGATLNPDMTVDIVTSTEMGFKRVDQVKQNPGVLFLWWERGVDQGAVPRVIFAKGKGEVLGGDAVTEWYDKAVAAGRQFEGTTREQAAGKWVIIRTQIKQLRAEGFTREGETLDRTEIRYGMTWKA
jgi:hypothetical protein